MKKHKRSLTAFIERKLKNLWGKEKKIDFSNNRKLESVYWAGVLDGVEFALSDLIENDTEVN